MEEQNISEWNMGGNTLGRMNFELMHCNNARRFQDFDTWWSSLQNLHMEIIPFLNTEENIKHDNLRSLCERSVLHYNSQFPSRALFNNFNKWERNLRIAMDKKNLLIKKGESATGAMI
tara:strand:- start:1936 stop:2289 length:354 start_codon:yes stop_codon:yes gene_type:complete